MKSYVSGDSAIYHSTSSSWALVPVFLFRTLISVVLLQFAVLAEMALLAVLAMGRWLGGGHLYSLL